MELQPLLRFRAAPSRRSIRLLADPPLHHVAAGRRARFTLRIENLEPALQDVEVYAGECLDGWLQDLKVDRVRLPAFSATILSLRVVAPAEARPGERQTFQVVAVGSAAPADPATVLLEAVVDAA